MTWERDDSAVGQNCLNYLWDPVTWLFPQVPLLPAVLQEVEEQQIEVILICPMWEQALFSTFVFNEESMECYLQSIQGQVPKNPSDPRYNRKIAVLTSTN